MTDTPDWAKDDAPDWAKSEPAKSATSSWGDVAQEALKNAPQSALNFAKDIYHTVAHPVETASNIGTLLRGVGQKQQSMYERELGVPVRTDPSEQAADATGKFFTDRYGSVDALKNTIATDPVGFAGDLSTVLLGPEAALSRVPVAGKIATAARVATDPISLATAPLKAGKYLTKELAAVQSGVGEAPLEEAFKAGREGGEKAQAFRSNMTGTADMGDAVNDARRALDSMRRERNAAYNKEMDHLRLTENGFDERDRILDFGKIDDAIKSAEEVQTFSGRSGTGPMQRLDPTANAVRQNMIDQVEHWRQLPAADFHTVEGMDALKRQLRNTMMDTAPNTPAREAASRIYNAVRGTITDYYPRYSEIMRGYESASNELREIQKALSLGDKASLDTALRKLQSTMRDNVNASFGHRAKLAETLADHGAENMRAKLAGQSLQPVLPRGLGRHAMQEIIPAIAGAAGFGAGHSLGAAAAAGATLPFMSPRLMGEAAYGAGAARRYTAPFVDPALRAVRPARAIGRIEEPQEPPFARGGLVHDDDPAARALRLVQRRFGGRIPHKAGGGDLTDPFVTSADDDSWKDREAQLGLELTGGNKQSWSDWLKSDSIAQRAVDAANYVGRFARDVVNAPRAIYENPSKADQIGQRFMGGENWVANMAKSGATLPGDVYSGKTPIYATDATGERSINPEVIERTQDLAGMAGGQTLATAGREAAAAGAGRDLRVLGHQIASDTNAAGAPLSALEHAPKFYSALEQAVETAPIEKGTGKQWLGTLTNKGVKKEEMDHTGTRTFLEANADKPVSKADLAAHVGENKVELGESNFGDKRTSVTGETIFEARDRVARELWGDRYDALTREQKQDVRDELEEAKPTRYHDYQLPGGENYRERLLTMPNKITKAHAERAENDTRIEALRESMRGTSGSDATRAEIRSLQNRNDVLNSEIKANAPFTSGHWDEPNVLVHRRTNDRTFTEPLTEEQQAMKKAREQAAWQVIDNRAQQRVVAQQIQARSKFLEKERTDQVMADFRARKIDAAELRRRLDDWGDYPELKPLQDKLQELRAQEDAIRNAAPPEPQPNTKRSLHIEEIQSDWHQQGRQKGYQGEKTHIEKALETERDRLAGEVADIQQSVADYGSDPRYIEKMDEITRINEKLNQPYGQRRGVPDAPFKKNWHELALKDAIREAAEKGMDRISWTPGEAQAARYDLSKQISKVEWERSGTSGFTPLADIEHRFEGMPVRGTIRAIDHQGKTVIDKHVEESELPNIIGKEAADKLLNTTPVRRERAGMAHSYRQLSGLDLKVGGEGMKGFYDKMLVDAANKIGKEHGVKVQKGEVGGVSPRDRAGEMGEMAERLSGVLGNNKQPVWYMDIPPSLKEQALKKGFALFEDSSTAGAPLSALERAAQQGYDTSTPLYHGTSKDKDFKSFKEGRHGTWTTQDPREASDYAKFNDSQGYRLSTQPGAKPWDMEAINSASRVMPLYGKPLENPAYVTSYPERLQNATNYKKAQSEWFDELRAKGHDGVILPGGIRVDFKPNENLRSQFAEFAPEQAGTKKGSLLRSDSAEAGAPISALAAQSPERQAFNKWFEGSKAVNEKGEPVTVYRGEHGELPEGEQHQTRLPGLTFVDNPDVANTYAMEPNNRNDRLHTPRVTPAHLSIKNPIIENHGDPFVDIRQLADKLGETEAKRIAKKYAYEIESTGNWQENIGKQYDNVEDFLKHEPKDKWNELYFDTYQYLDDPHEVNIAKAHGYDGAIHLGNGESATDTEYRVFSPHQVRSAILPEDSATAGAPLAALEKKNSRARDPNLWHGISDVKLPKPISEMSATREQTAGAAPSRIIRPADLQGSQLLPLIGDRSAAGAALTEVGGKRLAAPVDLQGGHGFMAENADRGAAWASGKMVATGIANRVKAASEKGPVHGVYTAMGERSVDFSHHVSDTLTEMLKHAKIGRDDRRAFDDAMRSKDANFPAITDWPGLGSSKLRSYLADATGQVRNKFAKTMDTRQFQAAGFPSVAEARFAVIDPKLLHEPVGASGLSVARLEPRAFPSQHRSYDTNVGGEYVGGLPTSVPKEVMYPKIMKNIEKYRKGMTGYVPTADYLMSRTPKGLPLTETADQKWVDTVSEFLRSRGYKGLKRGGRA